MSAASTPMLNQPGGHRRKPAGKRAETPRMRLGLAIAIAKTNRRRDLHLVNVKPRSAGPNNVKAFRLHRQSPRSRVRQRQPTSGCRNTTAKAGTAVGRARIRRTDAVQFAARPQGQGPGTIWGAEPTARSSLDIGNNVAGRKDAHMSPPTPPTLPQRQHAQHRKPSPEKPLFHATGWLSTTRP